MTQCKICKDSDKVEKIKHIGYVCSDCIGTLYELIEEASNNMFKTYIYPEVSKMITEKLEQGILPDWIISKIKSNEVATIFMVMDEMMFSDDVSPDIKDKLIAIFEDSYEESVVE